MNKSLWLLSKLSDLFGEIIVAAGHARRLRTTLWASFKIRHWREDDHVGQSRRRRICLRHGFKIRHWRSCQRQIRRGGEAHPVGNSQIRLGRRSCPRQIRLWRDRSVLWHDFSSRFSCWFNLEA